jgi:hypothetical protein
MEKHLEKYSGAFVRAPGNYAYDGSVAVRETFKVIFLLIKLLNREEYLLEKKNYRMIQISLFKQLSGSHSTCDQWK